MSENATIAGLRNHHPNTRVCIVHPGEKYGSLTDVSTLVRDWDALASELEHYKAEAEKWQALALRLADRIS